MIKNDLSPDNHHKLDCIVSEGLLETVEVKMNEKLKKMIHDLKSSIIQDVPNELAACERCRKTECDHGKWIDCENRLRSRDLLDAIDKGKKQESDE